MRRVWHHWTTTGEDIDIGHGHVMRFFRFAPDDTESNRKRYGVPLPFIERAGVTVRHPARNPGGTHGKECMSAVQFDLPELRAALHVVDATHLWAVIQWDPLTIAPSLLCMACGDHGFIRGGRWEPCP